MEIPGYIIDEEIGSGGMASVYRAVQSSLNRPVALKIMRERLALTADYTRRFLREARAVAQLQHRHIVSIYQVGVSEDRHFYSMQLLQGGDMAAKIEAGLDWPTLRFVLIGVCQALQYSHDRGFVHRDVKPGNILFDDDGHPYLTDFGLVRDLNTTSALTAAGLSLGTSLYMSPEQITGKSVSHSCDLYGLGVTAYEGVFGRTPFSGDTSLSIAYQHVNEPVPPMIGAPAEWREFFTRALAKSPSERFESAEEMATALRELPAEAPELEPVEDKPFDLPPPARHSSDDSGAPVFDQRDEQLSDELAEQHDATQMMPAVTPTPIRDDDSGVESTLQEASADHITADIEEATRMMPTMTPPGGIDSLTANTSQRQAVPDNPQANDHEPTVSQPVVTAEATSETPPPASFEPTSANQSPAGNTPNRVVAKLRALPGAIGKLPKEQKVIWGSGLAGLLILLVVARLMSGPTPEPTPLEPIADNGAVTAPVGTEAAPESVDPTTAARETVTTEQNFGIATVDLTSGEPITSRPLDDNMGISQTGVEPLADGSVQGDSGISSTEFDERSLEQQLSDHAEELAAAGEPTVEGAEPSEHAETDFNLTSMEQAELIAQANILIGNDQLMSPPGDNAFEKLSRVLQANPNNGLAQTGIERIVGRYLLLAQNSMNRGNYDGANTLLQRAQRADPDNPQVAAMLERYNEESSRGKIQALLLTGNDLLGQKRQDEAIVAYRQVLAIEPDNVIALDGLSRATRLGGTAHVASLSDPLRSGGRGPSLAIFQPGTYPIQWGSGKTAQFKLRTSFAMATEETSVALFKRFADDTGYQPGGRQGRNCKTGPGRSRTRGNWLQPGYSQTDRSAVACVDWETADAFAKWLSSQTGQTYRLPSEAEWLIANSALLGEDLSSSQICRYGDVGDRAYQASNSRVKGYSCNDGQAVPSNVKFTPTSLGIHGLIGGVSEWTADCWNSRVSGPPSTIQPSTRGSCSRRVIRGISWRSGTNHDALNYRVNERVREARDFIGFRVVRTTGQ